MLSHICQGVMTNTTLSGWRFCGCLWVSEPNRLGRCGQTNPHASSAAALQLPLSHPLGIENSYAIGWPIYMSTYILTIYRYYIDIWCVYIYILYITIYHIYIYMYGISQRVHRSKKWIKRTSSAENLLVKLVKIMVSCDCSLEPIRWTTFSKDPLKTIKGKKIHGETQLGNLNGCILQSWNLSKQVGLL